MDLISERNVNADVTVFVGDFGNEDVEVVRQVMPVSLQWQGENDPAGTVYAHLLDAEACVL
jgi:hypothetical protein